MMSEEKMTPKLRFSGFDDEWKKVKIKDISQSITKGTTPKHYADNGINFIKVESIENNKITKIDAFIDEDTHNNDLSRSILKKDDLLFSIAGSLGRITIINDDVLPANTNQALAIIRFNENHDFNLNFIESRLNTYDIAKYIFQNLAVGAQPNLNLQQVGNISINVPSYLEQNKIQNFIDKVNRKIELFEEKHASYVNFKKYLMQQIFTQKLRFDDFDEEWKIVKLKDIVERVTRRNSDLQSNLALTISAEYGLIDQEKFFNKIVASKSLKNYYLIKNGEFAYNKSYSSGYPFGAIKRLNDYDRGALSTLYICFKPTNVDSDFLQEYFETTMWYKEIYKIAVEGARNHGLLNIAVGDFFNTKHIIPQSIEEQQEIANFLKTINLKILQSHDNLNKFKNFKKGLLQQMFV